jgi:hypothetical protein
MDRLISGLKGQLGQAGAPRGVDLAGGHVSEVQNVHANGAQRHLSDVQGMNRFSQFLRNKRNQQVLGWLGGGLVVVATGLWVAVVYFFPPGKASDAKSHEPMPPAVQADCGGIAIGGNVTGATITSGTVTSADCVPKPR